MTTLKGGHIRNGMLFFFVLYMKLFYDLRLYLAYLIFIFVPSYLNSDMEKYLFLDFDGVLNTTEYQAYLFKNQLDRSDEYGELFDPQAVAQLERVIVATNARIVISSSWKEMGFGYLDEMWWYRQLPSHLHSVTPTLVSANFYIPETDSNIVQAVKYSKGLEVFAWIELHRAANNPYCIVDDEDLFFTSQAAHFVKTDSREGLTSEVADRIIQILEAEVG